MATYVPAKRGVAFRTWVSLVSRASRPQFQVNPTLAAGDVKVSKDGGALANLTTLPVVTPAASAIVQVDLSATEMTADVVTVVFSDAAGAEWDDATLVIPTVARQIDDLMFPVVSGRGVDVDATGGVEITADQNVNVNKWLTAAPNGLIGGRVDANAQVVGDKTGYALTAGEEDAIVNKVWDELTAEGRVGGSYGLLMQAIAGYIDTEVAAIKAKTDNLPASPAAAGDQMALTAAAIDLIHDDAFEGAVTFRQLARIILAAVAGKSNGFPAGPAHYRDRADTKDRITATVDADGNRSAVAVDGT